MKRPLTQTRQSSWTAASCLYPHALGRRHSPTAAILPLGKNFRFRGLTSLTESLSYGHLAVKCQANGELVSPRQLAVLFLRSGRQASSSPPVYFGLRRRFTPRVGLLRLPPGRADGRLPVWLRELREMLELGEMRRTDFCLRGGAAGVELSSASVPGVVLNRFVTSDRFRVR